MSKNTFWNAGDKDRFEGGSRQYWEKYATTQETWRNLSKLGESAR